MRILIILSFLIYYYSSYAQTIEFDDRFGGTVGVVVNLGTHHSSIGIKVQAYAKHDYFQFNAGNTVNFAFTSLGRRKKIIENRLNFGLVGAFGDDNNQRLFTLDGLYHQTTRDFAIGYNFLFYKDNVGSSQRSGGFSVHIKSFSILIENDLFAGRGRDRLRTGGCQFAYQYDKFNFKINTHLWTGETRGARVYENKQKSYKNLSELPFGKTSHGILYTGVDYLLDHGQIANLEIGFDSEKWRYHLQNNIIHSNSKKTHYYYPYLNNLGEPVTDKDAVRKSIFYFNLGLNSEVFY